jgi:hypothetical protein
MSLAIFSQHKPTREVGQQLGCISEDIKFIEQLISCTADVIFIDFTEYNNAWSFINELVTQINNESITCIISPYNTTIAKEELPLQSIIPRQSYTMKNGSQVNTNPHKALIYNYLHSGSGRTDSTTKYTMENITQYGGNNKILAWHFLAEIGHKLGFVPKYGA